MPKFKVGDEVKVIKNGMGINSNDIGKTTFITEIGGEYKDRSAVKTKDFQYSHRQEDPFWGWVDEDSFELVKKKDEVFYA